MIKYIIAIPIALAIAFLIGGILSHVPLPFKTRAKGEGNSDGSYGFYLGCSLFLALLILGIIDTVDGRYILAMLLFVFCAIGAAIAVWSARGGNGCRDMERIAEGAAKKNCGSGKDEKTVQAEMCEVGTDVEIEGGSCTKGQEFGEIDTKIGKMLRIKNNIVREMAERASVFAVVLCAVSVIFISLAIIFALVFRPLDNGRMESETVVFTEAETVGNVLYLYTEKTDVVYTVFGYKEAFSGAEDFLSRIDGQKAYAVEFVSLDRDDWSAYNALRSITDSEGQSILNSETAISAEAGAVGAVTAVLGVVSLILIAADVGFFCLWKNKGCAT